MIESVKQGSLLRDDSRFDGLTQASAESLTSKFRTNCQKLPIRDKTCENTFAKIKGSCGGRPFKIVNDSKFIKKCE